MKIIDAEDFGKVLKAYFADLVERRIYEVDTVDCHADLQLLLDEQPALSVCDAEAIIRELENCPTRTISVLKAVKIVKGGAV